MSTVTAPPDNTIRNLGLLRVSWNGITFNCTAKELPSLKDAPSWSVSTDNIDEKTGRVYNGKPAGLDVIELTIETDATLVYGSLLNAMNNSTQAPALFTYTPRSGAAVSVTVPKCTVVGLVCKGGNNNSAPSTIVRLQPEGGTQDDMPLAS